MLIEVVKKKNRNQSARLQEPWNCHGLDRVQRQAQTLKDLLLLKKTAGLTLSSQVFFFSWFKNAFGLNSQQTSGPGAPSFYRNFYSPKLDYQRVYTGR